MDEAHCIYLWGLQQSGISKHWSEHVTPEDIGIFRPSYGDLGDALMATDDSPLLLMSATCRPVAVDAILISLKIKHKNMTFIRGELTRPEIRIIRIYLTKPLTSAEDLARLFGPKTDVSDEETTPTLIYSGTQNNTYNVMEAVCKARGDPDDAYNGNSKFIRRFHAVTGEDDKVTRVDEYAAGKYPVISCTSALGLGTNWKRVRTVVVMGAMDPAESCQMIGRAGRSGNAGLAIILVQPKIPKGTNSLDDLHPSPKMTSEERMHAFRLTPCCLRVSYSMDNL